MAGMRRTSCRIPATVGYFDHIHTSNGSPLSLHKATANKVADCLKANLKLHRKGLKLFFADIDRLYKRMESSLEAGNSSDNDSDVK